MQVAERVGRVLVAGGLSNQMHLMAASIGLVPKVLKSRGAESLVNDNVV